MVWSLITLGTGLVLGGALWFLADVLEKKKAMKQTVAHPDNQDDMDNYED
jgi:hypothetical protein